MPSISASKYQTLRTCPRLFYWEQVRFIERIKIVGAREFGTLYHHGLESWWKTAGEGDAPWVEIDQPLVEARKAIDSNARHSDTDPYEVAKAHAMMVGYHARWAEMTFERIGEGVETYFKVPLLDPDGKRVENWFMTGKKDAFVKLGSRPRVTPVEHKTTTSDIAPNSDYDQRLAVDGQVSGYIDAANALGFECTEALYDMSRKPQVYPELKTPEEDREMTLGRGCKACGGSGGGKEGIKKGTGIAEIPDPAGDGPLKKRARIKVTCEDCAGTGWKKNKDGEPEAPRWKSFVRLEDEPPIDFGGRVADAIAKNPEAYFRHAFIPRTRDQINENRADLISATIEIDLHYARIYKEVGAVDDPKARYVFPRNTSTCLNIYGRRCDFLAVCSGEIKEPLETQLYQIRDKSKATAPTPSAA